MCSIYLGLHPDGVILLRGPGGDEQVKLLDSETVALRSEPQSELQRTVHMVQVDRPTVPVLYLAPEQWRSGEPIGSAADVYALGALLYFMISGEPPTSYKGADAAEIANRHRHERPRGLRIVAPETLPQAESLVDRMLSPRPADRPSLKEVEHTLICLITATEVCKLGGIGPYRDPFPVGFGGMGVVFRAKHNERGEERALKVPLPLVPAERVAQEVKVAETLRVLGHPGMVAFFPPEKMPDGRTVLVMEYLEGELCSERIRRGAISQDEALRLGWQVAEALAVAHRIGVVHRDLKPANLFLLGHRVKIIDFGIAKEAAGEASPQRLTQVGVGMGSGPYTAPEQWRNASEVDGLADVYALGVTLHEVLTGALPSAPPLPPASVPDPAVRALIEEMLSENKTLRPTMARVAARIRAILERRPASPWIGRSAALLGVAGLAGTLYHFWPVTCEIAVNQPDVRVLDAATGAPLDHAGPTSPFRWQPKGEKTAAVRLEKPGYRVEVVPLERRHSTRRSVDLQPSHWALTVEPKKAKITVGGAVWHQDSKPLDVVDLLTEGKTMLHAKVQLLDHATQELDLDTTADEVHAIRMLPARLIVKTTPPGASVVSAGSALCKTSQVCELDVNKLPPGPLQVELSGYGTVMVPPLHRDSDTTLDLALVPMPTVSIDIDSKPTGAEVVVKATAEMLGHTRLRRKLSSEKWPVELEIRHRGYVSASVRVVKGEDLKTTIPLVAIRTAPGLDPIDVLNATERGR